MSHDNCVRELNSAVILGMAVATISWSALISTNLSSGKMFGPHLPNANKKMEIIRLAKIAMNLHLGISSGAVKPEWPFGGVLPPFP